MSVGNLVDYGSKGTNFPWQLKMLQGLDAILSALSGGGSFLAPQTRVTNMLRSTTTGTITAGKYSASFANMSTTVNATVKGVTLKPGEVVNFDAGTLNNKLDAIAYDGTSGDLLIIYIS
jgi:aspartate aminotransferase-like enzyme